MDYYEFIIANQKLCWLCKREPCDTDIRVHKRLNTALKAIVRSEEIKPICPNKLCGSCARLCIEITKAIELVNYAYATVQENMEVLLAGNCNSFDTMMERPRMADKIKRTADGRIKCQFCDSTFTQVSSFKQHVMTHSGLKPFVCEYCGKGFGRRTVLKNHIRLHTGDKPYKCDKCILTFTTKDRLDIHIKRDHIENKKSSRCYYCRNCKKKFDNHFDKKLHHQIKESPCFQDIKSKYLSEINNLPNMSDTSSYVCTTCYKKFSTPTELLNHQKGHEFPTYECIICKITYTSKTELLYHFTKAHNEEYNVNINDIINNQILPDYKENNLSVDSDSAPHCSKRQKLNTREVPNPAALFLSNCRPRARKEKGSDEHKCMVCNAVFTAGPSLKVHLRTHTDEKPYVCHICYKPFTRNSTLKVHLRKHTKVKPFKCKLCDMAFEFKHILEKHMQRSHEITKEIELVLHCSECFRVFSDDFNLQEHMSAEHESTKVEYKCEVCKDEFNEFDKYKKHALQHNLQDHMSAENNNLKVTYMCHVCPKVFDDFTMFVNHAATHSDSNELKSDTIPYMEEAEFKNDLQDQNYEKDLDCKICESLRGLKDKLVYHIKKVHVSSANRSFRCHFCNELFFDVILLDEHLANIHNDRTYENQCAECSELFKNSYSYRRHIYKKHDSLFLCCQESNCNKTFKSQKSFDMHVVKHFI